jgi:inner membrane protein
VENGVHVDVAVPRGSEPIAFSFPLRLNGSQGVWLFPFARETTVALESEWPNPSFQGSWLPVEREITREGFKATWRVPYLGRNYPQVWTDSDVLMQSPPQLRVLPVPPSMPIACPRGIKWQDSCTVTFAATGPSVLTRLRVHLSI